MARVEKRRLQDGTLRYKAIIRRKGAPMKTRTFRTQAQAQNWAKRIEVDLLDGRALPSGESEKRTVSDLVERYTKEVLPQKPRSSVKQTPQIQWWGRELGSVRLRKVTPSLIAEKRDHLARERESGKRRKPATVNRYLAVLSHAFSIAEKEWEWVASNPCRKVRRLTEPRGRVRFLSDDERTRLLEACRNSTETRLHPMVVLALSTGARQGELLGLRWPDVDTERGVAVAHHTKNGERRALPLASQSLSVLADLGRVRRLDTDLVFADSTGQANFPRNAWEKALTAAQIEDFRFHDLRHSAASYLAMSGATLAEIAEVLGHKTLAMVKRYSHLSEQHTSQVVARMNDRIFGG